MQRHSRQPGDDIVTPTERRVLDLLKEWYGRALLRPGMIGSTLWYQKRFNRMPQHFARPAGRILRSLERKGLVDWVVEDDETFGWRATARGLRGMR